VDVGLVGLQLGYEFVELEIEILPAGTSDDMASMTHLADLVNRVYATAEKGQWVPGATRTTVDELASFTRAGEIVVARLDGVVVGSIRVQQLDGDLWETGMLVADPDHRNLGIGRELRRFVLDLLRQRGARTLQIELLVPRDWTQDSKTFMADWNERSGYVVVGRGRFEEQYPQLADQLATPCDFIIYNKTL
jgi:GNAT superfamily N-acetyltransferase